MVEGLNLNNQIVLYQSEDGTTQLDVKLEGETVWLNRQQMAELFGRDVKTIGKHINNAKGRVERWNFNCRKICDSSKRRVKTC